MPSKLAKQPSPPTRPTFLDNIKPDVIPSTDKLLEICDGLRKLKHKQLERSKQADECYHASKEAMKRFNERENGKSKDVYKIKRERDHTPMPEEDHSRLSPSKHRLMSGAIPSGSARSSVDPRGPAYDDKKKKKKRKRDVDDSDGEPDIKDRSRKATPPLAQIHGQTHHSKAPKPSASSSFLHSKPSPGQDFSIPIPTSLLPVRPAVATPPQPGPSIPTQVTEDFSKSKQPAQILVSTFYTSIEPYIRPIKEEDIGFLEYTMDEVEPYVMPKLGPHYSEQWEKEDLALYGGPLPGFSATRTGASGSEALATAPSPKWDPSTLTDAELLGEERGHGPLTERLVSALLPMPDMTVWKGVKAAEDAMEGRPGGSGAAAAKREKINVNLLEERIRDTMRFHGLLDRTPDYTDKVDDPIATALRQAQRDLREVVATNKARKQRLVAIARDRLGYQEYLDLRESIDKNISNTYAKLQKKDIPKLAKKKKKGLDVNGSSSSTPLPPPGSLGGIAPHPAALGLSPDEDHTLVIPDQLKQLVETRRQWVDQVGAIFEERQRENPGRIWGLPKMSVFEGIEEEVKLLLSAQNENGSATGLEKEKEKTNGDVMDVR